MTDKAAPSSGSSGVFVWGIDVSTKAVDLCVRRLGADAEWDTATLTGSPDRPRAFAYALREIDVMVKSWAALRPPTVVVVEDPYVKFGDQSYMIGVLALTLGLVHARTRAPVHAVASATWKATCGDGGAKKPQVMAWAQDLGYEGDRQDLADATCIAEHAAYLYRLAAQHGDL